MSLGTRLAFPAGAEFPFGDQDRGTAGRSSPGFLRPRVPVECRISTDQARAWFGGNYGFCDGVQQNALNFFFKKNITVVYSNFVKHLEGVIMTHEEKRRLAVARELELLRETVARFDQVVSCYSAAGCRWRRLSRKPAFPPGSARRWRASRRYPWWCWSSRS